MDSSSKKRQRPEEDDKIPSSSLFSKQQQQEQQKQQHAATTNPLQDIPTTQHYQVSYMHRSTVTHACTSLRHGYVLTGSLDGVVKFWKRTSISPAAVVGNGGEFGGGMGKDPSKASSVATTRCLEFVKSYSSHVGPLLSLCISQPNGDSAVSIGWDGVIKFYDVATFDVSGMIRTARHTVGGGAGVGSNGSGSSGKKTFRLGRHAALIEREDLYLLVSTRGPTREEWQGEQRERDRLQQQQQQQQWQQQQQGREDDDDEEGPRPATSSSQANQTKIGDNATDNNMVPPGSILLFSGTNLSSDPLRIITYHAVPVTALAYHSTRQWVVSGDVSGVLEVWNLSFSPSSTMTENGGKSSGTSPAALPFQSKLDTDLYALIKKKTYAMIMAISLFTLRIGKYECSRLSIVTWYVFMMND